jgi:hypothetical protein
MSQTVVVRKADGTQVRKVIHPILYDIIFSQLQKLHVISLQSLLDPDEHALLKTLVNILPVFDSEFKEDVTEVSSGSATVPIAKLLEMAAKNE